MKSCSFGLWYNRCSLSSLVSSVGSYGFTTSSSGVVHAWVGQIVTFFAYRPPRRPQGSLTPAQPGRVTNPTQGHPGPPWEAPQAECRSLRREPKPPA